MPAYVQGSAGNPLTALYPGDSVAVFNAEQPATGTKSIALAISQFRIGRVDLSIELAFSGAPGAFNYQVQTADSDLDANYITEANGTITAVGAPSTTTARVELPNIKARFVRILVNTQTANAVTVIAKISR